MPSVLQLGAAGDVSRSSGTSATVELSPSAAEEVRAAIAGSFGVAELGSKDGTPTLTVHRGRSIAPLIVTTLILGVSGGWLIRGLLRG